MENLRWISHDVQGNISNTSITDFPLKIEEG